MKNRRILLIISIVFVLFTSCLLIACNGVDKLVSPQNVSYDGSVITWDAVSVPDEIVSYTIKINGGDELDVLTGTSFAYDAKGESFEVIVTAKYRRFEKSSETVRFEKLATISTINVSEEGNLSWESVSGATGYEISNNGVVVATTATNSYSDLPVGINKIKVRPVSTSADVKYYSVWSPEKRVQILATPTKLQFDGTEISWNAVSGAKSYTLYINGVVEAENLTINKYAFSTDSDVDISVKAIGDKVNTFDSGIVEEEYFYLLPITNLTVQSGILIWDSVENADAYKIKINNVVANGNIETNSYDKLSAGTTHSIQVMPIKTSGNYFSNWTTSMSVYILRSPEIDWVGTGDMQDGQLTNSISWDPITGATSYEVKISKDGNVQTEIVDNITDYANAYLETGKYTISVKAIANVEGNYDSKFSNEIEVERLPGPTAFSQNFITSDARDLSKGFTATYNRVSGATGYVLDKNGTQIATTTNNQIADLEVYEGTGAGLEEKHSYSIRSIGSVVRGNGKVYVKLGCLNANALSFDITVLGLPQNFGISGFNAEWSVVPNANGYSIDLSGNAIDSNVTSRNLDAQIPTGEFDIKVCAMGDGATVLASGYTPSIHIVRLAAPTDIRFVEEVGNGTLYTNTGVVNATGYNVFIDGGTQAIDETALSELYNNISTAGTGIEIQVVANKYQDETADAKVYIMSSPLSQYKQFIRIKTPEVSANPFSSHVKFVWNAPINTSDYAPTYRLSEKLPGSAMYEVHNISGTEYNISYAPGVYTYKLQALGDGYKYVSSFESEEYSVRRLNTPNLVIENNAYNWQGMLQDEGYSLEINNVEVYNVNEDGRASYQYVPSYATLDTRYIELIALGDGVSTINSKAYEFTQVLAKCDAPVIKNVTFSQITNTMTVTLDGGVGNTKGYSYSIAGVETVTEQLTSSSIYESSGDVLVSVKATGGVIDGENVYWISSNYAEKTVKVLGTPSTNTGSFYLSGGRVHWADVQGETKYEYQIAYTDTGVYGDVMESYVNESDLIDSNKQIQKIKVRAIGNDVDVFTGDWVEYIFA